MFSFVSFNAWVFFQKYYCQIYYLPCRYITIFFLCVLHIIFASILLPDLLLYYQIYYFRHIWYILLDIWLAYSYLSNPYRIIHISDLKFKYNRVVIFVFYTYRISLDSAILIAILKGVQCIRLHRPRVQLELSYIKIKDLNLSLLFFVFCILYIKDLKFEKINIRANNLFN